jgi:putative acetyltransferase
MIDVRPTPVTDAEALRLIGESEAELSGLYPPEVRHAFSPDQLVAAGVRFVTAWEGGAAVGCGGFAPFHGYGELKRIFTTRAARGRGVGRAVVGALEALARAEGLALIRLETGAASPDALALYERLGYARRGPFGAYAENGSSVFMEKRLAL